jgi:BTB/POZ domain
MYAQRFLMVILISSALSKAMFTAGLAESDMEVVTLQGVEPEMIHKLIEYAYTGKKEPYYSFVPNAHKSGLNSGLYSAKICETIV